MNSITIEVVRNLNESWGIVVAGEGTCCFIDHVEVCSMLSAELNVFALGKKQKNKQKEKNEKIQKHFKNKNQQILINFCFRNHGIF